jgi:hypothetical protein
LLIAMRVGLPERPPRSTTFADYRCLDCLHSHCVGGRVPDVTTHIAGFSKRNAWQA